MYNKKSGDYLFSLCRYVNKTVSKKIISIRNINGNKLGIRKAIETINRVIITTINVSRNSFFPKVLPNSSFILPHYYLLDRKCVIDVITTNIKTITPIIKNINDHLKLLSPYSDKTIKVEDTIPQNIITFLAPFNRLISFFSIIAFPPLFYRINIKDLTFLGRLSVNEK